MTLRAGLAALALTVCACGDDGPSDAGPDGPPDPCAPMMTFTGEYLTWDSGTAGFMGINGATFTARGSQVSSTTAPNGRFEMCIPAGDGSVDVANAAGSDLVDGVVIVDKDVLMHLPVQSYRSFTPARAAEYGFSASQAHVFVHVAGGSRTVSLDATAGVQKSFDGTAWVDGNAGTDIYLGNIDAQSAVLTVSGGAAVGGGTIALSAGTFTHVTILAR